MFIGPLYFESMYNLSPTRSYLTNLPDTYKGLLKAFLLSIYPSIKAEFISPLGNILSV
jgi:hypothetical protein